MTRWRVNFVFFAVLVFSALVLGRLFYLQVIGRQYWQALAQGQQKFFVSLRGERGEIFFRDSVALAMNQDFDLVFAVPQEVENPAETASALSPILNVDKASLQERLSKGTFYEVLKRKLSQEELDKVKEAKLAGVYLGKEQGRYYPFEKLAAQTVGFLGGDSKGQYGVEGFYDEALQGVQNLLEKERGPGGYFINNFGAPLAQGADLFLTIDYNLQFEAEKLLEEAKKNLDFEKGEIIVVDPRSGEILALANFPGFDPNKYSEVSDVGVFRNSAFQELFEPGSVFKPITMAAALDQGKITPQTTYVDTGSAGFGSYTIYNYDNRVWGERTMTEVLEKSINTGAVFAQRQLGHEAFLDYLERFGFFEPTGIDLQGEVFSRNQEFKKGYEVNFATASFGQGVDVTSLQLVRAFSAIANGGKLLKPFIVSKVSQDGSVFQKSPEVQREGVLSKGAASQVTLMMVSTVENGFSGRARIPGYYIAGKTGTAQVPREFERGYDPDRTIQSFIGFAPALDPQFLILVKLHNPRTKTAEYSAVPLFRQMAKYIIDYWQIPPDYDIDNELSIKN